MRLPAYSKYKDSGVEWLGDVPAHWDVRRLTSLGSFSASGIDKNTVIGEPLVKMINYLDIYKNPMRQLNSDRSYMVVSCPEWKVKVHEAKRGDMFFTPSSETIKEIGLSVVCTDDLVNTVYSYHVIRFRPAVSVELGFQKYWCNNKPVLDQFSTRCKGTTRQILTRGDFRSICVPLPPLPEQAAIVRYLDYVERRIQRYAGTKRKLLGLLAEQKQAIIHRAVTRGLNPDVPLKPSGVEWLGDVPAHWDVMPLKRIGWFNSGSGFPVPEQGRTNEDLLFIKVSDMNLPGNEHKIKYSVSTISYETANKLGAYIFPSGTIIFPKVGGALLTNKRRILARKSCIDNNIMGCVVTSDNHGYVIWLLRWINIGRLAKPGPVPAIGEKEVGEIRVPFPHLPEQTAIAEYLDKITTRIDAVIARTQREIELINEYRTRLIADVVTGKVDVREAAAKLPDESDAGDVLPDSDADNTLDPETTSDEIIELDMVAEPEREY